MDAVQVYEIGGHKVAISVRYGVGPPTPYTLFLADHIPRMSGCRYLSGTGPTVHTMPAKTGAA